MGRKHGVHPRSVIIQQPIAAVLIKRQQGVCGVTDQIHSSVIVKMQEEWMLAGLQKKYSRGQLGKSMKICMYDSIQQSCGVRRCLLHIPEKEDSGQWFTVTVCGSLGINLCRSRQARQNADNSASTSVSVSGVRYSTQSRVSKTGAFSNRKEARQRAERK